MGNHLLKRGDIFFIGDYAVPEAMSRHIRFYKEHGALDLPHHNPRNRQGIAELEVRCDACDGLVAPRDVHGVINDHPTCTEVRFVAICADCPSGPPRVLHNVLRFRSGQLEFMQDGRWVRTTSTAWGRLWMRLTRAWRWLSGRK